MGFVVLGAALVAFYATERLVAMRRKATIEQRRAKAEYPITGNDPEGRTVIF